MPSIKEFIAKAIEQGYTKEDIIPELLKKGYTKEEINEAFAEKKRSQEQKISISEKGKLLFSSPEAFFSSVKEKGIKTAFLAYTLSAALAGSLWIVYVFTLTGIYSGRYMHLSFFSLGLMLPIILVGISILGTYIYSGVSHLMIKILKGQGSFADTYNACTYSLIPTIILTIIPYIGLLSMAYSIFLMTLGLASYHKLSKGKAVIAALLPIILLFALAGIFIIYLLYSFRVF